MYQTGHVYIRLCVLREWTYLENNGGVPTSTNLTFVCVLAYRRMGQWTVNLYLNTHSGT
jgi:hypothetical protein